MTRYELLDRIGVGGMAEIFRGKAVAAGGFEKPVAIKRIRPHLSQDRRFVELLIAEAKVLSLLKHRNIVQIFDVGLGDDGQYFLVMEFVDGKDLGAVQRALETRRRRLPFDLVLHIGAEICEALEHAHTARAPDGKQMSLVHRDVSPSNVLLSRAGEIKLTDFGIAKRAEQDVTHGGAVRGKFAYISPEQARNEPLDPRGDVFSVGILLWELICNRRLFSNLDDLAALRAVREAQVPRPTDIDPSLPPEIDSILLTALSKDKVRRYPSSGSFGAKLRSLRYSLDVTVGDPATELAKIIDSTEALERESSHDMRRPPTGAHQIDVHGEATVIRIHTADAFSARDNDASISMARAVIDRFEEEETRLAQLTGDQMRLLRGATPRRESNELTAAKPPLRTGPIDSAPPSGVLRAPAKPGLAAESTSRSAPRSRRDSNEPTRARPPLSRDEIASLEDSSQDGEALDEETKLLAARELRMPPQPAAPRAPAAAPPPFVAPLPQPPIYIGSPQPPAQGWAPPQAPPRDATPTAQDLFERPLTYPVRPSVPEVAGFGPPKPRTLQPWMLVAGAVIMALLAFILTRLFIR